MNGLRFLRHYPEKDVDRNEYVDRDYVNDRYTILNPKGILNDTRRKFLEAPVKRFIDIINSEDILPPTCEPFIRYSNPDRAFGYISICKGKRGIFIDFAHKDPYEPDGKCEIRISTHIPSIPQVTLEQQKTLRHKIAKMIDDFLYLKSEARDLQNGELSGLLRDPSKTRGIAKEGSPLDRALAEGILPKNVGQFLTNKKVTGNNVKPIIANIHKRVTGK